MYKHLVFVLFLASCMLLEAQKQSNNNPDIPEIAKCLVLIEKENYKELITVAEQGIQVAGNKTDALVKLYFFAGYGYEYYKCQYKNAIQCFEKSKELSAKAKNLGMFAKSIMRLNYMYYETKDTFMLSKLLVEMNAIVDTTKNIKVKAILYGSIAEYYQNRCEYENFLKYELKAIELNKTIANSDKVSLNNIGVQYLQISDAFSNMKQYDKVIEYCKYAEPYVNKGIICVPYMCDAFIGGYLNLNKPDSAQKYYQKISKIANENNGIGLDYSNANRLFAEYYLKQKNLKLASAYVEKAIFHAKKSNDEEVLVNAVFAKAKILAAKKQFEEAIQLTNSIYKPAKLFSKKVYKDINHFLSDSYSSLGDFKNAYTYNEYYAALNDTLLNETAKQNIANAEARFQNKTKQTQINVLVAQNTIVKLQKEKAYTQVILLILVMIVVSSIGLFVFIQNRNQKKLNTKLQKLNTELDKANQVKMKFFGILNHDLRSPIANLIHLLELQTNKTLMLDEETKLAMQANTLNSAENLLNSMEDMLLWSKGQMENFQPNFKSIKVKNIFAYLEQYFSGTDNVKFEFEINSNIVVISDEDYLQTICRNLTSNAVKATNTVKKPIITWKAWSENQVNYLSVSDNGSGIQSEKLKALYDENQVVGIKTGLGLHLIRDLAKAINCIISIQTELNQGSTFIIQFPPKTDK